MLPKNDIPIALGTQYITLEDTPIKGLLAGYDPDGDDISFAILCPPSKGNVEIIASSENQNQVDFIYDPLMNENAMDSFTFIVDDGLAQDVGQVCHVSATCIVTYMSLQ